MSNNPQVKQIIEYIEAKIANLKERLKQYETPMMQDMAKTSPYLQMDYIHITAELRANEDNLLAIQKFNTVPENNTVEKNDKSKGHAKEKPKQ